MSVTTIVLAGLLLAAPDSDPQPTPFGDASTQRKSSYRGPFAKGRVRVSVAAGTGSFAGDTSFIIGGSAGYFFINGLEVAAEADAWLGGDLGLVRVSPSVTYVLWQIPVITPYVGAFYRHWFVEELRDLDTIGARIGGYYNASRGSYIGVGGIYERQVSPECDSDCDYWYPELIVAISF